MQPPQNYRLGPCAPCNQCCLPCGRIGMQVCPLGVSEGKFSCCNHCCCFGRECMECLPCGKDGCLGYSNPLCGCCGNCNLMLYSSFCFPCFLADMHVASGDFAEPTSAWSDVFCNALVFLILMNIGSMNASAAQEAYDKDSWDTMDFFHVLFYSFGNVFGILFFVYIAVTFGKAASKIARKQNFEYEPAECCEEKCFSCCPGWCTSDKCCFVYWCCLNLHMLQVARSMEGSQELTTNVLNGRPTDCRCCNCWVAKTGGVREPAYGALEEDGMERP